MIEQAEVAILLATYNGEKFLREQLESILNQTFQDFVCYVHDDGSTDNTREILEEYGVRFGERLVLLNYETNHGAVGNFMSLIDYCSKNTKEPYIMFCDQDDVWFPNKIELQLNVIKDAEEKQNEILLVYGDQKLTDANLKIFAESGDKFSRRNCKQNNFKQLVFENSAAGCVICINRKLLDIAASYQNIENILMHDWWVMLIAACKGTIIYIDEPLMLYRQHGGNTLGAESKSFCHKVRKYLRNMRKSVVMKYNHVKKCEKQGCELLNVVSDGTEIGHIQEFNTICKCNKFVRMYLFYKKGYICRNELFTLLFT